MKDSAEKKSLPGWEAYNRAIDTNATEQEIIEMMNNCDGKSRAEIDEILNAFYHKHKLV